MSWDARGRHGLYFYRSVRVDGRVRKVYVGRGRQAEEMAREVEQRKQERQARRDAVQQEVERVAVAEQKLQELQDMADLLMRAVLTGMGLREHRGQWRRRRYGRDSRNDRGG